MNGFWILVIFVVAISIIRSMGIEFMKDEKNTVFHRLCAYLMSYSALILVYYSFCCEVSNFTLKTIYFDPLITDDKFYTNTYTFWHWFIVVALFAVGFVLFFKKTLELVRKNPFFLLQMTIHNFGFIVIVYFVIKTASVIILPDTVTNNVRTMHILKGTVFIPLTIIASLFIFRYTKEKLEKSIEKWDGYKNRVEENLKNRNRK